MLGLMLQRRFDYNELTAGIVKRLSEADDPNDIIVDICQQTGCHWAEAEGLVESVRTNEARQITRRQMPWLMGVALFLFAAGLIMTGYGVYGLITVITTARGGLPQDLTWYFMPVLEKGLHPSEALGPAILPYFNLVLGTALGFILSPISALTMGTAMILGSLLGMRDAWAALLNRES
jgi:hypothetical protein